MTLGHGVEAVDHDPEGPVVIGVQGPSVQSVTGAFVSPTGRASRMAA